MNDDSRSKSQNGEKFTLVEDGFRNSDVDHHNTQENGKGPTDFEQAITACGYGKFHYWILVGLIPVGSATLFSSGSMSYVFPVAECDLQLTDFHKGALNAAVYAGMIMASFLWGFASDIFGRKKLIMAGFLLDATFSFLVSISHSFWLLLLLRILGGTAITGPNALVYSYLAEIHDNKHRPKVIMITGAFIALAQFVQPALAYLTIPLQFRFDLIPGLIEFTSWRLFLMLCATPSFLASIVFMIVPESPKFLLSRGRTDEALDSFRRIYAMNTGKPPLSYPIKELRAPPELAGSQSASASSPSSSGILSVLRAGWIQVRPIFRPPHLNVALLIFTIQVLMMICINSVRLWLPQLFATLEEASALALENPSALTENPTVCDLLGSVDSRTAEELGEEGHTCPPINGSVYLRSLFIGGTTTVSFFITIIAVGYVGKGPIAKVCFPLAAAFAVSMYWASDSTMFMALAAGYTATVGNALTSMNTLAVDVFPTTFRSLAMSLNMMCGRIASVVGNVLFPLFLTWSCPAVFLLMGCTLATNSLLVWFIPNKVETI